MNLKKGETDHVLNRLMWISYKQILKKFCFPKMSNAALKPTNIL